MTTETVEVFHLGMGTGSDLLHSYTHAEEARTGTGLALALIQHVGRMRAAGYANEIVMDGEVWTVEVRRKSEAS